MMAKWTFTRSLQPGTTRNMASWHISCQNEEAYQIDVSWPLTWSTHKTINTNANAIYLIDGNAMFLTATETLRRRQYYRPLETETVVVAVGYPLTDSVFSARRSFDLTPPCDHYTPPDRPDGKPKVEAHGGADRFLTFITEVVRQFITSQVFPHVSFSRTALFGHSYGGLFVLHTLFTRPSSFDVYLAASPSIWWNDRFILSEAAQFCNIAVEPEASRPETSRPVLRLSFGSREQAPVRESGEPEERFQRRRGLAEHRRMTGNCIEIYDMLLRSTSSRLQAVQKREYPDEDHGSVIAPSLNGGLLYFLQQARD